MNTAQQAIKEMVDAGGRTAQSFGLNRLWGQIYMYLFLSPRALCLDELVEVLGVSKASVSIACRRMAAWGALQRAWEKGDRRDFYKAETDFGKLINNGLLDAINKKLDSARSLIEKSRMLLEDGDAGDNGKYLKQQLKEAERYRARLEKLINNPLMRRLL